MAKRKSMADVRQAIRRQIPDIKTDLSSTLDYVRNNARGRCLALEQLCINLEFSLLDKELEKMREQSYADEQQRGTEKP